MATTVDIAGNFPDLATRNLSLQVAFIRGATNFPAEIEHAPVSLHVFRPGDTDLTIDERVVRERRLTDVFITVKPGRAT